MPIFSTISAWIAAVSSVTTPYVDLVVPFALSGFGMSLFFAPVANVEDHHVRHCGESGGDFTANHLDRARAMSSSALVEVWRRGRQDLMAAVAGADPSVRVPWYGPPMSLASFVSARVLNT